MSSEKFSLRRCLRAVSQVVLALALLAGCAPLAPGTAPPASGKIQNGLTAARSAQMALMAAGSAQTALISAKSVQTLPSAATFAPLTTEPTAPEPPLANLPAEVAGKPELTDKRTANSATYDMGDGKYAVVQESNPLHYQDADGAWRRIDPAFVAETGGWINRANALKTGVGARSGRANLTHGNLGVGWDPHSLEVTDAAGNATLWAKVLPEAEALTGTLGADGRSVAYPASWSEPALQERWTSGFGRSEYSLRLAERFSHRDTENTENTETTEFSLYPSVNSVSSVATQETLDLRVTLRLFPGARVQVDGKTVAVADLPLETDGALTFVNDAGETLLLQPPQAYEEGDPTERVAGSYRLTPGADADSLELAARFPSDWLAAADRQYPVVLDPEFEILTPVKVKGAFYDINTRALSWWSSNPNPIGLGQYNNATAQAAVQFTLPNLPPGADITYAYLDVLPGAGMTPCDEAIDENGAPTSEYCYGDSADELWMAGDVEAYQITGPSDLWTNSNPAAPTTSQNYGERYLAHSGGSQKGGQWNVTTLVQNWHEGTALNLGILLKLKNEYCFKDVEIGLTHQWGIRFFNNGCGFFEIRNPSFYTPGEGLDAAPDNSGIRLVITYSGPTVNRGTHVSDVTPPTRDTAMYYNADHEYYLQGPLSGQWQAAYLRTIGDWEGPDPPSEADPGPQIRPLKQGLAMELYTSNDIPLDEIVESYQMTATQPGVSFALYDGNVSTFDGRVRIKAPGPVVTYGYEIGIVQQAAALSTLSVDPADPTPYVSTEYIFPTSDALAIFSIQMKAGTNSRVQVSGGQQFHNPSFNNHILFRGWLFKSNGSSTQIQSEGKPMSENGLTLSGPDLTPETGDKYALVVAYNGPDTYYYGATNPSPEVPLPMMLHQVFTLTVRVTSCPANAFPLSDGTCQRIVCPNTADLDNPAKYRAAGGFGLSSDSGWDGAAGAATSAYPGNAPLIGPPGAAPTVAVIEGTVVYDTGTDSVTIDGNPVNSAMQRIKLVDCNTPEAPRQDLTGDYYFDVHEGYLQRELDGATPVLRPSYGAYTSMNIFRVWSENDKPSLSNLDFNVRPLTGKAQGAARLARDMAGPDAGPYSVSANVRWEIGVAGWPSLSSTATRAGIPTPPDIAGLTLSLGNDFSMDTETSGDKDVPARFVALRASAAAITQPDDMGGASKPLQAVILQNNYKDDRLNLYCENKSCVDLRATDDVFPGAPKRTWSMPDIHINGAAGLVLVNTPGQVHAWSTDHPALQGQLSGVNGAQAVSQNFSFDTFGGNVSVSQDTCDGTDVVTVIRGETTLALPMVGDGASADSMVRAGFKLCADPTVGLRQVLFEFRSPIGVPVGSTGLFVNGLKGEVRIAPTHTEITFGMDFYFTDPATLQGHGDVTIDTRGMFEFQGTGKILSTVNADGRLWVAWDPLDTGFQMHLGYALGDVASIDGDVRAHAWRGQGWQNKYSWLPNNPDEEHFAAQISASFTINEGALIDIWPLVIPPVDLSREIEIAFGQFCTSDDCTSYEWGIKAAVAVCGYHAGVYYGFDHGVSIILGNDGHTLIDQYGGAYARSASSSPRPEGKGSGVRVLTAPLAVNGEVTMPLTITAETEEFLVGLGWQIGDDLTLEVYRPDSDTPVASNAVHTVFISDTTPIHDGIATRSYLLGVQLKQPGAEMAGIWTAVISGITENSNYKFTFLANKGGPGTPENRGRFTAPAFDNVDGTGGYRLEWEVLPGASVSTTISLYYRRCNRLGGLAPYVCPDDTIETPIVLNLPYQTGYYDWDTSDLKVACPDSTDGLCYHKIHAIVDDGVNDFPEGSVSDPDNYCKPCSEIPPEYAYDSNRFPGISDFRAVGHVLVTDAVAPATPTGLTLAGTDGAILAEWNPNSEKDLETYLVEWGVVDGLSGCPWVPGAPTHAERVPATLTPTLRIGGLYNNQMLPYGYGVSVSAIDINGNVSGSLCRRGTTNTSDAAKIPTTPNRPVVNSHINSTSIALLWVSPNPVDHYRLAYQRPLSVTQTILVDDIPPRVGAIWSSSIITLTDLLPGMTYVAWVAAGNGNDWYSGYSQPMTFTVTNEEDSDGDGLPDDWEAAYKVHGGDNDPDYDGLTNLDEYLNGTNPRLQDSDDDSFSDGEEVISETNALDYVNYPAGYTQPRLILSSRQVNFYARAGGTVSLSKNVALYNEGGGELILTATDDASWISAAIEGGAEDKSVQITASTAGLEPGVHYATVYINRGVGGILIGGSRCIRVQLHLLPAQSANAERLYLPAVLRGYKWGQWEVTPVDPNGDAGQHASVAIDPTDDSPYISYYDSENGNLRMTNYVGEDNGNCGPHADWVCKIIKTEDNVGKYSSIAVWPGVNGVGRKVGIAYYNDTSNSLEYAEYTEGGVWTFTVIAQGDTIINTASGLYASLKFDASGSPRIAYQHFAALSDDSLRFAKYVGGSAGSCTDTAWECSVIESGEGMGSHAALDLDADGNPHIAYYNDTENSLLCYAHYVVSGGNCGPNNDWRCDTIESVIVPAGDDYYIAIDGASDRLVRIAYNSIQEDTPVLKYATPTGGECGPDNTWNCIKIVGNTQGLALASNDNYIRIAYHDIANGALKIARPTTSGEVGNCGPMLGTTGLWQCSAIDDGGTDDVGAYPAIAFRLKGFESVIAYYNVTNTSLQVALEHY